MRSKLYRRPSPALIVALLALIVAVTPVADAATAVKRALFADNAGKVGGIKASKTPKAGQLLALGKNKKFPKSVLPLTAGPQGPPGPQGAAGSNATINGVAAGGSLAGTYPNPTLAPGAVGLTELGVIPAARAERTTAQTIGSGGAVATVSFDSEAFDTAGLYNPAAPTCLEAPVTGIYELNANVRWQSSATGTRWISFDVAGARHASAWQNGTSGAETDMSISTLAKLTVGQCARLIVYQTSGGNLDLIQNSIKAPSLSMHWVAKG